MMGTSHLTTGVTSAAWMGCGLAAILPATETRTAAMAAVVAAFCALAPDLDHVSGRASRSTPDAKWLSLAVRQFGGHRTWTHDLRVGPPVFAAVVGFGAFFLHGPMGTYWWAFALAVWVGCMTHIWADSRTISGVPCGRRTIHLGRPFRTGSEHETRLRKWIYQPVAVASVVAAIWVTIH